MIENRDVSEGQVTIVEASCLSDKEIRLLAMFRAVGVQRQKDVLRMLEAFTRLAE